MIFNLVEILADDSEKSFNQSCKFGCLVAGHAVYCHSDNSDAPRKCHKTWASGGEVKDEDCEFYQKRELLTRNIKERKTSKVERNSTSFWLKNAIRDNGSVEQDFPD